ncbi:hypothetical protein [Piscirickettsia salmonis]|nr:hypothetical protein [Piscirickettsia salmonis]QNR80626.1 hypothetical protein ICC15_00820 [Piscirickettsia salmonis]
MLGDFASLDVQNTYRGSDAYGFSRQELRNFLPICELSFSHNTSTSGS